MHWLPLIVVLGLGARLSLIDMRVHRLPNRDVAVMTVAVLAAILVQRDAALAQSAAKPQALTGKPGGKPGGKKDLGMIASAYGNVYVAQIALGEAYAASGQPREAARASGQE